MRREIQKLHVWLGRGRPLRASVISAGESIAEGGISRQVSAPPQDDPEPAVHP